MGGKNMEKHNAWDRKVERRLKKTPSKTFFFHEKMLYEMFFHLLGYSLSYVLRRKHSPEHM